MPSVSASSSLNNRQYLEWYVFSPSHGFYATLDGAKAKFADVARVMGIPEWQPCLVTKVTEARQWA
jgi:hypothetical protein